MSLRTNPFSHKTLEDLRQDARFFYSTSFSVGDELTWVKRDGQFCPEHNPKKSENLLLELLQKIWCIYDCRTRRLEDIAFLKALNASEKAKDWAVRLEELNAVSRIENRAMFEFAKLAFKTLQITYQSESFVRNNYQIAVSKLENILRLKAEDYPIGVRQLAGQI